MVAGQLNFAFSREIGFRGRHLLGTSHRGIALGVAEGGMRVEAHVDAAYGVHTASGKSHSGCSISLGIGPVYVASKKQKIVTKPQPLTIKRMQKVYADAILRTQSTEV